MTAQLLKDTVNYEKLVGEGKGQTMVAQDLVLSDRSPEIGKVLSIDGRVNIISTETSEERVIVDGKVTIDIFYSSLDDSRGIYKLSSTNNFTQNINLPQSDQDMKSVTNAEIEHIEYEIVSNRKIKVNSIINLESTVYNRESLEIVVDMKGEDIQLLRDNIEFAEYQGEDKTQSIVKINIDIPQEKDEVSSILKSDINIHRKEITNTEDGIKINVSGTVRLMYDTSSEDIHTIDEEFAFETEINTIESKNNSKHNVSFKVIDVYESISENDEGERRKVEIEAVVDCYIKSYNTRNLQSILDAYSPDEGYELEKTNVKCLSFFGEASDSKTIKERINVEDESETINQIKYINLKPIVTETKVIDDKVIAEGILEANILYLAEGEKGGISNLEEQVPFKTSIEIEGSKIDMIPIIDVNIEHISFDKISSKEVDLKIILNASAKLLQKKTFELIKNVVEVDVSESIKNMPTFVIYCIQKDDNLWKIAKRYATTIEDIVNINSIENPENIAIGTKIIIPKKTFVY